MSHTATYSQSRCHFCRRFVYRGQLWCRDCAPDTPCRDFPPTCAPYGGECCMEAAARERILGANAQEQPA